MNRNQGSILSAMLWMAFLSLILFWLPVFGGLIAGFVGGQKAGSAGKGFMAVLLPMALLSFALVFLLSPLIPGAFMGLLGGSMTVLLLASNFPLVCGAIVGGALAR